MQQAVNRFRRDQFLQLRSDNNWLKRRAREQRDALHVFAVLLTQWGRGMVRNNSSNLACEPELWNSTVVADRSDLAELSVSMVAGWHDSLLYDKTGNTVAIKHLACTPVT